MSATRRDGTIPDVTLPVDSFRDAAPLLRRPFTPQAVKHKVQAAWPSGALVVAYIDARLVIERLNLVCPHLWHDEYEPLGKSLICRLTVDGITRTDIGSDYVGKGLFSDALKRAGVKFGIGVSLYAIPRTTLDNQNLDRKPRGGKEQVTLNASGEKRVRDLYAAWLASHGESAFGPALDHGDCEEAIGDPDVEPIPEPTPEPSSSLVSAADAKVLRDGAKLAGWDAGRLRQEIAALIGRDPGEIATQANALTAIRTLTKEQAGKLDVLLESEVTA